MNPQDAMIERAVRSLSVTRRHFFRECGVGVGKIALGALLAETLQRASSASGPAAEPAVADPMAPKKTAFSGEGRSGSSTSSWPAGRASSIFSTTSRS